MDVDRGRSITVEQAFSGTDSFGKHSIFINFCSEEEKKKLKHHSRVLMSTIFLRSLFLASPAQPTSFRDLSSQSIKTLFLDNHIRCAPVRRCAPSAGLQPTGCTPPKESNSPPSPTANCCPTPTPSHQKKLTPAGLSTVHKCPRCKRHGPPTPSRGQDPADEGPLVGLHTMSKNENLSPMT